MQSGGARGLELRTAALVVPMWANYLHMQYIISSFYLRIKIIISIFVFIIRIHVSSAKHSHDASHNLVLQLYLIKCTLSFFAWF